MACSLNSINADKNENTYHIRSMKYRQYAEYQQSDVHIYQSDLDMVKGVDFIDRLNCLHVFWGELIDKYIDINANSKTVFTDYAMLKLVLYSPHMFL